MRTADGSGNDSTILRVATSWRGQIGLNKDRARLHQAKKLVADLGRYVNLQFGLASTVRNSVSVESDIKGSNF